MTVVGIDLDGVVCDFLHGAAQLTKNVFGLIPDFENLHRPPDYYTMNLLMDDIFDLDEGTFKKDIEPILVNSFGLFKSLPRLEPDNYLLTRKLYQEFPSLKCYFITARDAEPLIIADTYHWVNNNGYEYDQIFHSEEKAKFCSYLGVQVMIEDEPRHIVPLIANGVNVIAMDQPWNQNLPDLSTEGAKFRRAHGWEEALSFVKEILA